MLFLGGKKRCGCCYAQGSYSCCCSQDVLKADPVSQSVLIKFIDLRLKTFNEYHRRGATTWLVYRGPRQ